MTRHGSSNRPVAPLEELARTADPARDDILVVLRYILRVAGEVPFEELRRRIAEVAPALEEHMASHEERFIQKGLERGLAQGREQGLAQGREDALRDAVARLLRTRFGELDPDTEGRIATASAAELESLLERVVTAPTLHDVFGPRG